MTEHTPGPWQTSGVRQTIPANEKYLIVGPDSRGWVAAIPYGDGQTANHLQAHADAKLIAAAPETAAERDRLEVINAELIDLLRAAVSRIEVSTKEDNPSFFVGLPTQWLSNARAAIAKAREGGS